MNNIYLYPKFSKFEFLGYRIGGEGLGNLLFPFARCLILSKKYGIKIIYPSWKSIKIGPILRGEFDNRFYGDLFINNGSYIDGLQKYLLLTFSKKFIEKDIDYVINESNLKPKVIYCKGRNTFFKPLYGYNQLIKDELYSLLKMEDKCKLDNTRLDGIVVHIRMGDFISAPKDISKIKPFMNYRLPIDWYINIIFKIREFLNKDIKVYIFSDGTDDELQEILYLNNVERVTLGKSILDILALSKGKVLIGSGSTFSMWASFLGEIPSIWFPDLHPYKLISNNQIFEGCIGFGDDLPDKLKFNLRNLFD